MEHALAERANDSSSAAGALNFAKRMHRVRVSDRAGKVDTELDTGAPDC
jgi:hypothetical protein